MKEQWSISENNMQLADMEKGLYQGKQKYMKRIEYKTNCCIGCIPYLRLILLLEVTLFFGWGCYMILQNYRPGEIKSETTSITIERNPSMIESESLSEIQKSKYPNTEIPGIFVKPEVIIDKINNFLEDMKFAKDQDLIENKETVTLVTNVPRMMQANMQNSNHMRSNNIGINAIDRLLSTLSSRNLDKKFTKSSVPQILFSVEYTDKNTDNNIDKDDEFFHPALFFEKLRNISKIKATNDLEEIERNDFTENVNRLTLGSQENHALDESNKLDDLELNIVAILNPENFVDHSEDLINTLQDSEQEFSDSTKDAAQDDRDENSLFDDTDKRVNVRAEELGIVVCPPYESHEFSDMLTKDSSIGSPTSQPLLAQESLEQIENGSSDDIAERIEDKHDIKGSDMSAFTSGSQDRFDLSGITVQDIEDLYSPESFAKMKENEKYESTENTENPYKLRFLRPNSEMIESSTPNVDKFQWFNGPPSFVDLELGDILKSSEIHHRDSSLLRDTNEDINVDDVIPGSQCEITIKMGILKVNCPAIKFNEEWNVTSPEIPPTDVPKVTNFGDILDGYLRTECDEDANEKLEVENISNENSDKEVTASRNGVPKINNAIESQESTSVKIDVLPDDALPDLSDAAYIDPFDGEEINHDYAFYDSSSYDSSADNDKVKQVTTVPSSIPEFDSSTIDSNEGQNLFLDISGTQQQEQLISKERDSDNSETSLKDFEHFHALEKQLTSLLKNEMSNIMTRYLPKSSYENNYRNNICNTLRYMRSISQHPWREQYAALRKLLEYKRNSDYPHGMDDSHYRRKRMTDDLTWQQAGKARECRMESDCAGIQNTTCMSDPRDGRTRCLCGDYSAPLNGACANKFKVVAEDAGSLLGAVGSRVSPRPRPESSSQMACPEA
ncbi:oogenesis-related protein sosie isoform X2 [Temnothorax americanus]|uniref:oogenesis-related protein sosie isoform X2 n=1 Tax=Temnothorax americanus TaxID=1964332 RepID=UPI0040676D7F